RACRYRRCTWRGASARLPDPRGPGCWWRRSGGPSVPPSSWLLLPSSSPLDPSAGVHETDVTHVGCPQVPVELAHQVTLEHAEFLEPGRSVDLHDQRAILEAHGACPAGDLGSHGVRPLPDRAPAHDAGFEAELPEERRQHARDGLHDQPAASGNRSGITRHNSSSSACLSPPTGSTTPAARALLSRKRTCSVSRLLSRSMR